MVYLDYFTESFPGTFLSFHYYFNFVQDKNKNQSDYMIFKCPLAGDMLMTIMDMDLDYFPGLAKHASPLPVNLITLLYPFYIFLSPGNSKNMEQLSCT